MKLEPLIQLLETHGDSPIRFLLPGGDFIPDHFHITEVGRVEKQFIDCGGTRRQSIAGVLQVWTANDLEHRLLAGKLAKILAMAAPLVGALDLPLEVEYGAEVAGQYRVTDIGVTSQGVLFVLSGKQTACLALEKCGLGDGNSTGCCV